MDVPLYDAHNHLQDERLRPFMPEALAQAKGERVRKMVVNGSCEEDWSEVLRLARQYPEVIPSFGYHPWYVTRRSAGWRAELTHCLNEFSAGVGEIGLDRWMREPDLEQQEEAFIWQLRLAAERNLPASIHCLQAWGKLLQVLRANPLPECGFVLHSFGGPQEMIGPLAELGAYFSLPGYFAHPRKQRQREAFREVPPQRLLIETDAPDQLLPEERTRYPLTDPGTGKRLNHPANLSAVYEFAAELLGLGATDLARQVEENFLRVFGGVAGRTKPQ